MTLETADGLRVEQTQVKHKAVPLGTVQRIDLSEEADHVVVHIAMDARAEPMLTDQASFWVVRPRRRKAGRVGTYVRAVPQRGRRGDRAPR